MDLLAEFGTQISILKSFLSPNVHCLLCVCGAGECCRDGKSNNEETLLNLNDNGLIKWDELEKVLQTKGNNEDFSYFKELTEKCQLLFGIIEITFRSLEGWDEFEIKYGKLCKWLSHKKMIKSCFNLLSESSDETVPLHVLLILLLILERGLGDLVMTECGQCPLILRDLLLVPKLNQVLSPVVVKFLRLLVGPPTSLNLRNVSWHGFLAPKEFHPKYVYAVLCTILSIGEMLNSKNIMDKITHREFISLPNIIFKDDSLIPIGEITKWFLTFGKMLPTMERMWHLILHLFEQERYGECLVVLLPLMEHMMRCMYALVNNLLENVLTAENSLLFTTFDEILSSSLPNNDNNKFPEFMGNHFMDMIMDCLVYQDGPRIRDKISHGEVNLMTVNRNIAHSVLTISTLAQMKLLDKDSGLKMPCKYKSQFHPIATVSQKVISIFVELHELESHLLEKDLFREEIVLTIWNECKYRCKWFESNLNQRSHITTIFQSVDEGPGALNSFIDRLEIRTLYRYELPMVIKRREREIMNAFDAILSKTFSNINDLKAYLEQMEQKRWNKDLRSRQRATYDRLLITLPYLICASKMVVVLSACFLQDIQSLDHSYATNVSIILKFLKNIKQFVDNFENSFTNHKWLELQMSASTLLNNEVISKNQANKPLE